MLRAVSLTVPAERAVGGLVTPDQHVDIIATFPITVTVPLDPETGEPTGNNPETGEPYNYVSGSSTKLMWLDVKVITHPEGIDLYVVRIDLQTAEEIAHAQNQGAQFTMALRPETDTRDIDRSNYGETTDTLLTRYNFRVPETIDGTTYEQPLAFPSPFPAEPYLTPAPSASPEPDSVSSRSLSTIPPARAPRQRSRRSPSGPPPAPARVRRTSAQVHPRARPRRARGSILWSRWYRSGDRHVQPAARPGPAPASARRRSMSAGVHAPPGQPLSLDVAGALDEPDLVAALGQAALDELDGLDHHEGVTVTPSTLETLLDESAHAGMDDGLEVPEPVGVG